MNTYDFEVTNLDGSNIPVSLRLSIGAQIKLKKKYNEPTTSTLFNAVDDVERFVDVMDLALKFKDNNNLIQSGETLIELMISNDMLGMSAKQHIITAIGRASGLFSSEEQKGIDSRSDKMISATLGEK